MNPNAPPVNPFLGQSPEVIAALIAQATAAQAAAQEAELAAQVPDTDDEDSDPELVRLEREVAARRTARRVQRTASGHSGKVLFCFVFSFLLPSHFFSFSGSSSRASSRARPHVARTAPRVPVPEVLTSNVREAPAQTPALPPYSFSAPSPQAGPSRSFPSARVLANPHLLAFHNEATAIATANRRPRECLSLSASL